MRYIILLLILFPCFAFPQATKEDYAIYSQYLKEFESSKKVDKMYFVVNESTAVSTKNEIDAIRSAVSDLRLYTTHKETLSDIFPVFKEFTWTLEKDTLWIHLIEELEQKMQGVFKIENNFSPELQTTIINEHIYNRYFKHFRTSRRIEKNWTGFHKKYKMPSALIELSEIAEDGKRAVFYFSWKCGGLCGEGDLIFFNKENDQWKFLASCPLWFN